MAITDSLYLYCTDWKATSQTYQYYRNPFLNPKQTESNQIDLLSVLIAKSNNGSIYSFQMCNKSHSDNNNNTGITKITKTVDSSDAKSIMNCKQDSVRDNDLYFNYCENTKFELMKIKRTYNLMIFLLNEKQICSKHFDLIKLFVEQLQRVVKHLEKGIDNKLKNLVNFSLDIFAEKIVTKGSKYLKNIINCSECGQHSIMNSPLIEQSNNILFSKENCNHYYSSIKSGLLDLQNSALNDDKIKMSPNCKANRLGRHLLSNNKIDYHQLVDVVYSNASSHCFPTMSLLESSSSLPPNSCSLSLFYSTCSLSSSSSSSSSLSSLSSPLTSPLTCSTCTSVSNNSIQSPTKEIMENTNFEPIATGHFQTVNNCDKHKRLENKQIKGKLLIYHPVNLNNIECKQPNGSFKKSAEAQKIPLCLYQGKPHTRNTTYYDYSQQYSSQNNQSEIENCQTNLNTMYPYAVSRRPSVRDMLSQRKNSPGNLERKQQQSHLLYISNDHNNCHQSNSCINCSDYLFSENNLNMGVVPPPNLNPFAS
ncbi:unnamed protein product [Schistosoma turkestanicum]|nr:unnamed protein product [Schistosoma turkestanicum]